MNQSLKDQAANGAAVVISSHLLALVENLCTYLLILHRGRSLYFGPTDAARAAFEISGSDTSLEEVFFRVTEGDGANGSANGSPPPIPAPTSVSRP